MAKRLKNIGPYQSRKDKRGFVYYVRRKTGQRVKSDTVSDYIRRTYQQAPRSRGRYISKKEFYMLSNWYKRAAEQNFSRADLLDMINKWSPSKYKEMVSLAKKLPELPMWLAAKQTDGRNRFSTDEVLDMVRANKANAWWLNKNNEMSPYRMKLLIDEWVSYWENWYIAEQGGEPPYFILMLFDIFSDGSVMYKGKYKIQGPGGEVTDETIS